MANKYATETETNKPADLYSCTKMLNENAAEYYDVQMILLQPCCPETK